MTIFFVPYRAPHGHLFRRAPPPHRALHGRQFQRAPRLTARRTAASSGVHRRLTARRTATSSGVHRRLTARRTGRQFRRAPPPHRAPVLDRVTVLLANRIAGTFSPTLLIY